jgi:hypothetical protein
MKKLTITFLLSLLTVVSAPLYAQSPDAHDKLKKHINEMVVNVQEAETATEKRAVLNQSFDDLVTAFNRVSAMEQVPQTDKEAIADFKNTIMDKKHELNGTNGYEKVPDKQLDEFADYVQQDIEQADRAITISLTTALLIIIILLLL